jgi:hypothetical protein
LRSMQCAQPGLEPATSWVDAVPIPASAQRNFFCVFGLLLQRA